MTEFWQQIILILLGFALGLIPTAVLGWIEGKNKITSILESLTVSIEEHQKLIDEVKHKIPIDYPFISSLFGSGNIILLKKDVRIMIIQYMNLVRHHNQSLIQQITGVRELREEIKRVGISLLTTMKSNYPKFSTLDYIP